MSKESHVQIERGALVNPSPSTFDTQPHRTLTYDPPPVGAAWLRAECGRLCAETGQGEEESRVEWGGLRVDANSSNTIKHVLVYRPCLAPASSKVGSPGSNVP